MTSPDEWKRRANQLARAVAPVVSIAHRCSVGDTVGLDLAIVRTCLADPLNYFRQRNKTELVASIELLIQSLETGEDQQERGEHVLRCVSSAYPNGT
jgi:hypothetical protein